MTRLTLIVNLIFILLSSTADAAAASSSSESVSSSSVSSSSVSSSSSSSSINHTSCGCCNKKKPASCPKHEELSECVQNLGRAQNCTQKNRPIPYVAVPKESCKKGCVCVLGFLRDSSGKCIPDNKCPVVCASDEEFSNCTQALCRRLNCSQQKYPVACASVAEGSCESGCVCQSGLLRTASGTCVPDSQCYGDLVCDDTEVVNSCPKKCDNDFCPKSEGDDGGYCSEDQNESDSCGEPVCVCRFNYKRSNENDTCIPTRDCPAFECSGINEEYNSCPPFCPTDDCSQATPTGRCPLPGRIGIVLECRPACRCISGYWRNNGVCVPYAECPGKCPVNEKYSSCIQGECRALDCTQKGQPIACPGIAEGSCQQGCVCVEGTLRAADGSCVPEDQCPVVCPAYEEFSNCTQAICRQLNCSQQGQPLICAAVAEGSCLSGCVCQSGYLRTAEGTCVPENQCYGDLVCEDYEVVNICPNYSLGDYCPKNEEEATLSPKVFLEPCAKKPKCTCRFNYKKDDNGTCIPTRDCPPFECSGENEEYNSCPPLCPTDDCIQATPTGRCPLPGQIGITLHCRPACRCISGYWRKNGVCVPYAECPGICPTNEKYSSCIQGECRALDCTQKGQPIACPGIAEGSCQQGCVCVEGTLRAADGSCVSEDKCPVVCPANEEFNSCTQAICRHLNCSQQGQPFVCAAVAEGSCLSGCVCQSGYLRTDDGTCVPENQCYPGKCPANEKYSSCIQGECRALDCIQKGQPIACPGIAEGFCQQGCVCVEGTLRAADGSCVPEDKCPVICPANEEFDSCTQAICRHLNCSQQGQPFVCAVVAEGSCLSGCVCQSGYLRTDDGTCVPENQCYPGKCPANEKYSSCIQGECRALDCTQKGQPIACPRIAEGSCQQGCVCVEGTLRAADGSCVPDDQCLVVCPAYEEFSNCTQAICRQLNCSQQGQPLICAAVAEGSCLSGCVCQSGYLRTAEGTCVPENQCYGDLVCEDYEVVNICPNYSLGDYCPKNEEEATLSPKVFLEPCAKKPKCTCRFNYKKDDNGTCIPTRDCPPFECSGENEEYNSCPPLCPTDDCIQATPTGRCPLPGQIGITLHCRPACRCISGYWRKNGVCVPYAECPESCPSNEE